MIGLVDNRPIDQRDWFVEAKDSLKEKVKCIFIGLTNLQGTVDGFTKGLRIANFTMIACAKTHLQTLATRIAHAEAMIDIFHFCQSIAYFFEKNTDEPREDLDTLGHLFMLGAGGCGIGVLLDEFKIAKLGEVAAGVGKVGAGLAGAGYFFFGLSGIKDLVLSVKRRIEIGREIQQQRNLTPGIDCLSIEQFIESQAIEDEGIIRRLERESALRKEEESLSSAALEAKPLELRSVKNLSEAATDATWEVVASIFQILACIAEIAFAILFCTGVGSIPVFVILGIIASSCGIVNLFIRTAING